MTKSVLAFLITGAVVIVTVLLAIAGVVIDRIAARQEREGNS